MKGYEIVIPTPLRSFLEHIRNQLVSSYEWCMYRKANVTWNIEQWIMKLLLEFYQVLGKTRGKIIIEKNLIIQNYFLYENYLDYILL